MKLWFRSARSGRNCQIAYRKKLHCSSSWVAIFWRYFSNSGLHSAKACLYPLSLIFAFGHSFTAWMSVPMSSQLGHIWSSFLGPSGSIFWEVSFGSSGSLLSPGFLSSFGSFAFCVYFWSFGVLQTLVLSCIFNESELHIFLYSQNVLCHEGNLRGVGGQVHHIYPGL